MNSLAHPANSSNAISSFCPSVNFDALPICETPFKCLTFSRGQYNTLPLTPNCFSHQWLTQHLNGYLPDLLTSLLLAQRPHQFYKLTIDLS